MFLHALILGLLLGWGAAIPIGPMNLEIIRRNLTYGTRYGVALGLGVCSADITYIALLSFGALVVLNHPLPLAIIGFIGSIILAWFGYNALRLKSKNLAPIELGTQKTYRLPRHTAEG